VADREVVALLGAGSTMGLPMARNILRAGIHLRAWNRTREKAQPLLEQGAEVLDSPGEAAEGAGILLTMLADAEAVLGSASDAVDAVADGALWLQMSTIGEAGTDRCIELAREHGLQLVDAPVLGTKQPAEQAKLVVLAAGPRQTRSRAQRIFDTVAQKVMWIGDEPGAGTRLKIALNSWVLTVVEGAAETIALAQGLGLDPALLFDALEGGALDLPYLRMKGKAIVERNFEPAFRLKLAAKDAALVEESARRHELDLPLFEVIRRRMAEGAEQHPDSDMSATYLTSAPRA
jgi:3-hydroxyisobutyrate dehydrogenase